jgi:Nif-specific regulatory protein
MVAINGPRRGSEFTLRPEGSTVGRDTSSTICLEHLSVSRNHCVIRSTGDEWLVTDLDSHNGTYVNGVPVKQRSLRHGDEVQIGDCVLLFVSQASNEPADSPLPARQDDVTRTVMLNPDESRYLGRKPPAAPEVAAPEADGARIARDLETLLSISVSIQSLAGVAATCHHLLQAALEVAPARRGAVWLACTGGAGAGFGWQRDSGAVEAPPALLAVIAGVARERATIVSEAAGAPGVATVTAPILAFDRLIGVLAVEFARQEKPISADHLQMLSAIAMIAGPPLEHAVQLELLEAENRSLRDSGALERGMVGESAAMRGVLQMVAKVAAADSTVLIRGESGAGKELVARAIHANSPRAAKPFIAINCATLSEALLESELFGHERGAFTGAIAQKKGKLELAEHGTLFLDEVCEMAPALQAKLLRVLQEREFERVGGVRSIRADIRLIAATNRDLESAVESGAFRRDLYYRLNVIPILLPPLRERREDIGLLANFFIARYAAKTGRKVKGVSPAARAYLNAYDWPGNVRELENAMERAVVLGSAEMVVPEDLPETLLEGPAPPGVSAAGYHEALMEAKKQLILASIEKAGGSQAGAARLLGLHPNYLSRLIRNLNLKDAAKAAGQ